MDTMTKTTTALSEFVTYRVFNASAERIWRAWTDREQLMQWFGPQGYIMTQAKMDLRPGGIFHYALRSPEGQEMWGKWLFREIEAPQKLVTVASFSNAQGGITRHPLSPGWPLQILSTTTFKELDGKTTVTVRWAPLDATEQELQTFADAYDSMKQGWSGTFTQLAAYLDK
ncbi:MAG: SRPBCC domain-containing protein [Sideroxyarcus sp.]|nr:SRPBCC domain-containing protein [Sideroxyarcus sp.]